MQQIGEAARGISPGHKGIHSVVDALVQEGNRAKVCCRLLCASRPRHERYKNRVLPPTQIRRYG